MNILFFGSKELLARVRRQTTGQCWDIYCANEPDHVLDYAGTHSFQAALFGLCEDGPAVHAAAQNAKTALNIPVAIGLASRKHVSRFCERSLSALDIVLPECGNDRLSKQQCDAILRLANGVPSKRVRSGGLTFHVSDNRFSVKGQELHLPPKKHKLLELLFLKRGRTVTKEMVFNHLYGWKEPPEAKIIDVFICQIRRALREAGLEQECIETVWGHGYRLVDLSISGRHSVV